MSGRCNCVVVWDFLRELHMWLRAPLANCDHPTTGTPYAKEPDKVNDDYHYAMCAISHGYNACTCIHVQDRLDARTAPAAEGVTDE